jgi:hypothetical protein
MGTAQSTSLRIRSGVVGVARKSSRSRGRRRVWSVVGVLASGLVVAACTTSPSASKHTGSSTTSTTHRDNSGTTTTTTPPPVPANVVADRSVVPWSRVGSGWLLATWSKTVASVTGQGAASPTLLLLDPEGGRYNLGPAPSGRLVDWSGDGTYALFLSVPTGAIGPSTIGVEDVRTGTVHTFTTGTDTTVFEIQFTKPKGTAVLVAGSPARRYNLSGALEATYPSSLPGQGTASHASGNLAETPTGGELVLQADGGLDVVTNAGAPVRFIPPPSGQRTCFLDGWWTASDVIETCGSELFAQPATGGPASVVAAGTTGGEYIKAWTVGGHVVAEAGACGTTWIETIGAGGVPKRVTVPGAGSVAGIGAAAGQLAILVTPSCEYPPPKPPSGNLLEWYTPASGVLRTVLGGNLGGGTVDAAVVEDTG